MLKLRKNLINFIGERKLLIRQFSTVNLSEKNVKNSLPELPDSVDVVVVGGGTIGVNTLYYLSKLNINAILLERGKLTSGTTWHTSGVIWSLRPSPVDIQLLAETRSQLQNLENETGLNPGWINNGGLFISRSPQRTKEYQRLQTLGKAFNIKSQILNSQETVKICPLLDRNFFECSLFSPSDGVIDPTMMVNSIGKGAKMGGGRIFEDCSVEELIVGENFLGGKEVKGVRTQYGSIKSNLVINATGVWGSELLKPLGIALPLIAFKHSYVVSEAIPGLHQMTPNIRDHDNSIVFRIQGKAFNLGGYEKNPILLESVPSDFQFSLYDLDYSTFDEHIEGAMELIPAFKDVGIKNTICGPESFTPDHRPLMGPDPFISNLFHNCGYNSAGIMYGAGCAKQLANWVVKGRPELPLENYDVRRFTERQRKNYEWIYERSHEAYATNYGIVYPHCQHMAGRNFEVDELHEVLLNSGAIMEEKMGFERPAYFLTVKNRFEIPKYDFHGFYGHQKNKISKYEEEISKDCNFDFYGHHEAISIETQAIRESAAVINLSSFSKFYITGSQANEAVNWIFTADFNNLNENEFIKTCILNHQGGIEGLLDITKIDQKYYCVVDGAQVVHQINEGISEKKFDAKIIDVSKDFGILSIQGPKSGEILQKIKSKLKTVKNLKIFTNIFGFDLHIPKKNCLEIYETLISTGLVRNAGFRALNSVNFERGQHLHGFDINLQDSPLEANLESTIRKTDEPFKGQKSMLARGVKSKLTHLKIDEKIPLWGMETVYCDGEIVGYLRRGDWSFKIDKAVGSCYIPLNKLNGKFEIEVMGEIYKADKIL